MEQLTTEAPLGRSDHSIITVKLYCDKEITTSTVTKYFVLQKGLYQNVTRNQQYWLGSLFGRDIKDDVRVKCKNNKVSP